MDDGWRVLRRGGVLLSAAVVALAGCGGSDPGDDVAAEPAVFTGGEATFVGTGAIAWESEQVEAEVVDGALDATIVCEGSVPHNLIIEGVNGDEEILACEGDDRATATVELAAGASYAFWCDVPGHRGAGMEGVLTTASP